MSTEGGVCVAEPVRSPLVSKLQLGHAHVCEALLRER